MDVSGKVVGFGARAIGKDALPKYINSPESPIFSKRSILYGLDKAKREIVEKDEAIIVEGYFDLISLHRVGVRNAVATLGTSITEDQIARLRNYTENITLMLDGDEAGVKSALRLITLFGEMGINGNMVVLPDGQDPDTFVQKEGILGFARFMKEKRPLLDYFFASHMKTHEMGSLEGKLFFIKTVIPYLEAMKDVVKRRLYVQRLAEITGVEEYRFWDSLAERPVERETAGEESSRSVIEEKVVGVLINKPEFIKLLKGKGVEGHIRDRELSELLSAMFGYYEQNSLLDIKFLLNVIEKEELRDRALMSAMSVSEYDEQEMKKIVEDYLLHVEQKLMRQETRRIREGVAEAEKRGDQKTLQELLEQMRQVLSVMKYKSAK
jgi:DNA primase